VSVVLTPCPAEVTAPGFLVSVHDPAGKPVNATDPVATAHVGDVISPITGADGILGGCEITTLPDEGDTHPNELVTVNVKGP
jgi:hypothetical protein